MLLNCIKLPKDCCDFLKLNHYSSSSAKSTVVAEEFLNQRPSFSHLISSVLSLLYPQISPGKKESSRTTAVYFLHKLGLLQFESCILKMYLEKIRNGRFPTEITRIEDISLENYKKLEPFVPEGIHTPFLIGFYLESLKIVKGPHFHQSFHLSDELLHLLTKQQKVKIKEIDQLVLGYMLLEHLLGLSHLTQDFDIKNIFQQQLNKEQKKYFVDQMMSYAMSTYSHDLMK